MNEKDLSKLEKKLGITFKDISILKNALIHRSFINENRNEAIESNERLEYLGDAVLELAVSEFLFKKYPQSPEGDLTSFRSAAVRTESLAEEAVRLNFGEFIYMSAGEEMTGGRERIYILANTVEAIIGGIYLDRGYAVAKEFIEKNICYKIDSIVSERSDIDAKSKLQEVAQEVMKITPTYELLASDGPDHSKNFTMGVFVGSFKMAEGEGKSKQIAERNAALKALETWENIVTDYQKSL